MTREPGFADVGVLGAGITGCCLALELARRGFTVDLIDRASAPMTGASLHNEGKLHLGFVYANDPLKQTHHRMLHGSLAFARIIESLTGHGAERVPQSRPFHYFVPTDSQLSVDAIERHFHDVEVAVREAARSPEAAYLGRRLERCYQRNTPGAHAAMFAPHSTLASFETEERSVSTVVVARLLCEAVRRQPRVRFVARTEVLAARQLRSGEVEIETRRGGGVARRTYPSAANCLWDDKLRVDRTFGVAGGGPWLLRYKATVSVFAPSVPRDRIPSATGVLGPYADIVNYDDGWYYVSWYPLTRLAQSTDEDGRRLHDLVHRDGPARWIRRLVSRCPSISGLVSSIAHRRFVDDNLRQAAAYVPAVARLLSGERRCKVGGGVIVAQGTTDIDDPGSHLHRRSAIGPVSHGPYVSVDTGKYCTGPKFALEAADKIAEVLS